MRLESMQDVFLNQLRDVLSAEKQLTKALPKMAKAARSTQLAEAFENHLAQTEKQIERLEQVFESLGKRAQAKHCHGMEGLIKEGDEAIEMEGEDALIDCELIAAAQRVEHYEIAAYGTLANYAQMMGLDDAAGLLNETLEEEKAADRKLTEVNESEVSASALSAGMERSGSGGSSGGSSSSGRGSRKSNATGGRATAQGGEGVSSKESGGRSSVSGSRGRSRSGDE